jgi:hypothetical protein
MQVYTHTCSRMSVELLQLPASTRKQILPPDAVTAGHGVQPLGPDGGAFSRSATAPADPIGRGCVVETAMSLRPVRDCQLRMSAASAFSARCCAVVKAPPSATLACSASVRAVSSLRSASAVTGDATRSAHPVSGAVARRAICASLFRFMNSVRVECDAAFWCGSASGGRSRPSGSRTVIVSGSIGRNPTHPCTSRTGVEDLNAGRRTGALSADHKHFAILQEYGGMVRSTD